MVTDDTDRGIRMFAWAHDGQHLLYLQDTGGDENWRLHDVDLETMQRRDLTPFDDVQTDLIAGDKKFPTEILVGLNRDNPQLHDVYRLNLTTGELVKEVENPGFIGWVADSELVVRAGIAPQPDGGMVVMVRGSAAEDWQPLLAISAEDALTSGPVAFSEDGRSLLAISSVGADTGRLVRIDLATGAEQVLAEDPEADVTGIRLHPDTREPQIVSFLKDRMEYRVLDPALEPDLAAIRALHPGDPSFSDHDDADETWLVAFNTDAGPVSYYSYDRRTRTGEFLFDSRPELARYELAPMEPFSFTARDGLAIHGYATFPPGAGRENLPMVLDVHGGPWARDAWGFDPEAQWLANRGYLCVQVNFRGSTGYGKAFVNAGDREWGGRMQDDLSDAVAHVTSERLGRPGPGGDLRRFLRRLRVAGRRGVHAGIVPLRGGHRRAVQPEDADRDHPAVLGPDDRAVPQPGRRPGQGRRFPLVPLPPVAGGRDQHPAAHRAGRQRPAGQAGRVGADRRGPAAGGNRTRVPAVSRRGARVRQAGEPAAVLRGGRAVPRAPSRRPG